MRLRADITIEFEAADFVDAAKHQQHLEQFVQQITTRYANAKLAIRERRTRYKARFDGSLQGGRRMVSAAK
jgi:hypothetical protein